MIKMKIKKIVSIIAIVALIMSVFIAPAYAASEKNETVYGILNADGSVESVYVVNQLLGDYVDYGSYTQIKNLSSDTQPTIEGDKITFPDEEISGGLYYQGTIDAELPMTFEINYYIDGKKIDASDLGGASGHLKIKIDYAINDKCDERLTDGIIAQIMITLNMDLASNINYYDGTSVITGNTMTISYTSLFEESGIAQIEADVTDFEMDSISISLLKGAFSLGDYENTIDSFKDGFLNLEDGAGELIDGTTELKGGIKSLVGGVKKLSSGLVELDKAGEQLSEGNSSYAAGLRQYTNGVLALSGGSSQIKSGLNDLASNGSAVASGVSQASSSLASLSSSSSDLAALAQTLLASDDPSVRALAQGTIDTLSGVSGISAGLSSASSGLESYTAGVSQAASNYAAFDAGIAQLAGNSNDIYTGFESISSGFNKYSAGLSDASNGLKSLYSSIRSLPGDIQLLIDGQVEFKDGISEANEEITNETDVLTNTSAVVSFASPDKNNPSSVQYILITPAIKKPDEAQSEAASEQTENFFTRFADLFK